MDPPEVAHHSQVRSVLRRSYKTRAAGSERSVNSSVRCRTSATTHTNQIHNTKAKKHELCVVSSFVWTVVSWSTTQHKTPNTIVMGQYHFMKLVRYIAIWSPIFSLRVVSIN